MDGLSMKNIKSKVVTGFDFIQQEFDDIKEMMVGLHENQKFVADKVSHLFVLVESIMELLCESKVLKQKELMNKIKAVQSGVDAEKNKIMSDIRKQAQEDYYDNLMKNPKNFEQA